VKSLRLIPVVVVAVAAVLLLKTIGLISNGGYVLGGVTLAQAQEGEAAADTGGISFPEPTIEDTSPVLADTAPTMGSPETQIDPGALAAEHMTPEQAMAAALGGEAAAAVDMPGLDPACREEYTTVNVLEGNKPVGDESARELGLTPIDPDCPPSDGVPMTTDASGNLVPLENTEQATNDVLGERLAERREEQDAYAQELAVRASLVDAAEKRLEERTAALEALEARVTALIDERTAIENEEFASVVAMYEAMRPKDAAAIFNDLDMNVLLRVAKKMSARKMAPIMAEMTASRAQELTVAMSTAVTDPIDVMEPEDLAALPQIVGQ